MPRRNRKFINQANHDLLELDYAGTIVASIQEEEDVDVSVSILEEAITSLRLPSCDPNMTEDLYMADTREKLKLNRLGDPTRKLIQEVINHSSTVEAFIKDHAKGTNDPDFPKKLRAIFFREYKRLFEQQGLYGDDLFSGVRDAISAMIPKPELKCAALSILVHLFIICDLFERPPQNDSA